MKTTVKSGQTIRLSVHRASVEFQIDRHVLIRRLAQAKMPVGVDGCYSIDQVHRALHPQGEDLEREQAQATLRKTNEEADLLALKKQEECQRLLDVDETISFMALTSNSVRQQIYELPYLNETQQAEVMGILSKAFELPANHTCK